MYLFLAEHSKRSCCEGGVRVNDELMTVHGEKAECRKDKKDRIDGINRIDRIDRIDRVERTEGKGHERRRRC